MLVHLVAAEATPANNIKRPHHTIGFFIFFLCFILSHFTIYSSKQLIKSSLFHCFPTSPRSSVLDKCTFITRVNLLCYPFSVSHYCVSIFLSGSSCFSLNKNEESRSRSVVTSIHSLHQTLPTHHSHVKSL